MIERLSIVPLIVKDLDEALKFYTEKLGFVKVTDATMGPMHFVTVAPKNATETEILLFVPDANIVGEEQAAELMSQIGQSPPSWIFKVDDCEKTVQELKSKGVEIIREPQKLPFGIQAMFTDIFGNIFVLSEPLK